MAKNLRDMQIVQMRSLEIVEYHPQPNGQGKPTEVNMLLEVQGISAVFVMRFKSRRALDEVVAAMQKHADAVWPPKQCD